MSDSTSDRPFDESAALVELERFRQEIERYRIRRQVVTQEFDAFIESMPAPEDVFPTEQPAARTSVPLPPPIAAPPSKGDPTVSTPASRTPVPSAPETAAPPPAMTAVGPAAVGETFRHEAIPAAQPAASPPRRSRRTLPVVLTIGVLTAIGGFATILWRSPDSQPPAEQQPAPASATAPTPGESTAAAPAPAPAPLPLESELVAVRRAWVRIIADGERVVERELPAGTRIPFTAEQTIVIRTGDAGAVTLTIRGQDQGTLGKDGAVITRTFAVPPRQ
jgi:hypothetical protein